MAVIIITTDRSGKLLEKQFQNFHCCYVIHSSVNYVSAQMMERQLTVIVCMTNRIGSCIDEELNNSNCDVAVAACMAACSMEWRFPTSMISSTGSGRKLFEKTSNYSLCRVFIAARLAEEMMIAHIMIIMC